MNEKQTNWCACEGHNATDWTLVSDFYAKHFIPRAWVFEYRTMDCHDDGRVLYITGTCDRCGGFMRSGTSIPTNIKGDELLAYVYRQMTHYRPYVGHDPQIGTYHGSVPERSRWYQRQDDLTLRERNMQFLRLFKAVDRPAVSDWLARNHAKEPYTSPHRDRKSTLLQRILEMARDNGAIKEAEDILDYILPNDNEPTRPDEDGYLTDYRFDFVPHLSFGCEGMYLDLYLVGSFDSTDRQKTTIGTFKTLRDDLEACWLMGRLGGALMYYGRDYVNQEIHRYTPGPELERMMKEAKI